MRNNKNKRKDRVMNGLLLLFGWGIPVFMLFFIVLGLSMVNTRLNKLIKLQEKKG